MGKIIKFTSLTVLNLFLLLNFLTYSYSSEVNDTQKESSVYTDFVQAKNDYAYDIETSYQLPHMPMILTDTETYMINDLYAYHKTYQNLRVTKDEYREQFVITRSSGNTYYERISRDSSRGSAEEYIPYFKKYDETMYTEIIKFLSHPIFGLESHLGDRSYIFSLNANTFDMSEKEYVESYIKSYLPSFVLPSEGNIEVYASYSNGMISYVTFDYSALLGDDSTLKQKINIRTRDLIDRTQLFDDSVDLANIESDVITRSHYVAMDEVVTLANDYFSLNAEYKFIQINTAGEYKFTSTSDNKDLLFSWYLYDLEGNQLKPYIHIPFGNSYDQYTTYIYLNPGVYYIYLSARPINCNLATLTYTSTQDLDDYQNSFGPDTDALSNNQQLSFQTDYQHDIDTFVTSGDFDYLVVSQVDYGAIAFGNITFEEITFLNNSYIIPKPFEKDLILYFFSDLVQSHELQIKFYKESNIPASFDDAPQLDIYAHQNAQLALPFQGQVDRFKFTIDQNKSVHVAAYGANHRILSTNLDLVQKNSDGFYELPANDYYIELYAFTGSSATFTIAPENFDDDQIVILPSDQDTYHLQGFLSSLNDVDIYQFTLDTDTSIQFNCDPAITVLIYGVDNPYVNTFDMRAHFPYFLPAGTFNLTLPAKDKLIYNFEMTKVSELHETEFVDYTSIEVSGDTTSYTFPMSFDFSADSEKLRIQFVGPIRLHIDYPAGLRINGVFTRSPDGSVSYFSYPNTSPDFYISYNYSGEVVLTFETLVQYAYQDLLTGNFDIIVNLTVVS